MHFVLGHYSVASLWLLCGWNELVGSPLGILRPWLLQRGWEEDGPWSWIRHDVRLSMRANAQLRQQLHNLRVGWRDYCWTRFLPSGRHEVEDVGMFDIRAICRCDFKHLRSMMVDPGCRSVALGATVSPAWFRERPEVASDRCPWCPALGTWAHLCWLCPQSPLQGMIPARPRCPLLCRWGWGTKAQANIWASYVGLPYMLACLLHVLACSVCLSCLRRLTLPSEGRNHAGCSVPFIVCSGSTGVPGPFGGCWHRNKVIVTYCQGPCCTIWRKALVCNLGRVQDNPKLGPSSACTQ